MAFMKSIQERKEKSTELTGTEKLTTQKIVLEKSAELKEKQKELKRRL